jgi:hypothetical protein
MLTLNPATKVCQLEEAHEAIEGTAHAPRIRGVA